MKMDREQTRLKDAIQAWNESRLDLFGISQPDKDSEFHGVIRFYHQDSSNNAKYATKCVRVSSTAFTCDVIETLAEKFRSDMRMLTKPNYGLYEVHVDGETRKLGDEESPLLVQLNWIKDDREGRFLLRNEEDKRPVQVGNGLYEESEDTIKGFKLTRNLTKKEKKQKKKKEKNVKNEKEGKKTTEVSAAKQLYNQVPESTFTRTVSNPEAVMKKRREQKLQKRGAETLKIYGDSINHEIPYKTLLLLPTDKTDTVVRDTLDKYSLGREKTSDYDIVQVVLPPGSKPEECLEGGWGKETILGPDECPLDIEQKWQPHQGTLVFQLRKNVKRSSTNNNNSRNKPSPKISTSSLHSNEKQPQQENKKSSLKQKEPQRKDQRKRTVSENEKQDSRRNLVPKSVLPKFVELSTTSDKYYTHDISPNVTEMGSDRKSASYGPFIELRPVQGLFQSHCVVTNMDSVVTVTPHEGGGEVFVDNRQIEETTMLSHGDIVWLGRVKELVFCEPNRELPISEIKKKIKFMFPQIQNLKGKSTGSSGKANRGGEFPPNSPMSNLEHGHRSQQTRQQDMKRQHSSQHRPSSNSSGTPSDLSPFHQEGKYPKGKFPDSRQHQLLPALLKINPETEETFLSEILSVNGHSLHFKLSPAYSIYLALRNHIAESKTSYINEFLITVTDLLEQTIQMHNTSVGELSFWMANTSELLNFVRQDQQLSVLTGEAQDTFAKTVQLAFRHLVQCMQRTLFVLMPAFLSESDEDLPGEGAVDLKKQKQGSDEPTMYDILHMLTSAMSLLRRCRVNAALTIQLFSQLFHSINMWLFNKLVTPPSAKVLCCRQWGIRIRARLAMVETWAEKQGLELAADCHLARITQATHLLQAPKQSAEDIAAISGTCFKLNSLQLRALLSNYQPHTGLGERIISMELIDEVVTVAESSADELTRSDGRDVRLKEDPDLQLPFLLPEDGYSCDVVRGIPSGLAEFVRGYQHDDLCKFDVEPNSNGSWTIHFNSNMHNIQPQVPASPQEPPSPQLPPSPEIVSITFNKRGGGMGLSIVAARGSGQNKLGIYVRSVVPGGAAHADGRLMAGDQLLSVDGNSLVGLDQEKAATLMTKTGQTVTLDVAKQGAVYHGLATLLSQPSPKLQRPQQRQYNPRPKSEGFALVNNKAAHGSGHNSAYSSLFDKDGKPLKAQPKQNLNKSTPHLNEKYEAPANQRMPANNPPRSAMSMQNLQHSNDHEPRNSRNWRQDSHTMTPQLKPSKEANYQNQRQKATSSTAISNIANKHEPQRFDKPRFDSQERSHPRDDFPSPPNPTNDVARNSPHSSLDNPNYDHFPLPPPDLTHGSEPKDDLSTPRYKEPSPMPEGKSPRPSQGSKTLGRATMGKAPEVARVAPTQKKAPKDAVSKSSASKDPKSSTLPRHFKSASVWERDARERQEQAIQEQLNALRDEEIEELEVKDSEDLTPHEKDRLKNLLQERDFQNRVQEEKMRIFSDEDNSEEDFSVPDRPDRDRLIRIQDAQGQRNMKDEREAEKKKEMQEREAEKLKWEEEQRRKKEEAERRDEEERERREKRARERERKRMEAEAMEEKRKAERRREEQRRYEEEKIEEDQRRQNEIMREEEQRRQDARMREEEQRREEQRRQDERMREEEQRREEQRRQDERMREEEQRREDQRRRVVAPMGYDSDSRSYNDRYSPRSYNSDIKWSDQQSSLRKFRDEEEEQRKRLEDLRKMREEEEKHLRVLKKQKQAEAREEAEREFLEEKLSQGKRSSSYKRTSQQGTSPRSPLFHGRTSSTSAYSRYSPDSTSSKPAMRDNGARSTARPVSDGYMLGRQWDDEPDTQPTVTPPPFHPSRRPISYVATSRTPGVIGSQEVYNDPRNRREATLRKEQSFKRRAADPSKMTFKDRQRLFQQDKGSPINKPKTSRKLLEIEQSLKGQM